jgi:hypothetical protein
VDPGDPIATNRLGIGLLNLGRHAEALAVLEAGLLVHPDNAIMRRRLEEARDAPEAAARREVRRGGSRGPVAGWTDFEPAELVESALAGPGRDACVRLCAASIRAGEALDATRTAVTPVKAGRRFRTIAGIFTGVAPWNDTLTVAVPIARTDVIRRVEDAGGGTLEPAKAVPCVQIVLARGRVEELYDDLVAAHRQYVPLSVEFGPPTHLNKHNPALRAYLLEQADALGA